jgi:hypothetical protein
LASITQNESNKELWLQIEVFEDDRKRLGITHDQLLKKSGLFHGWHEVTSDEDMLSDRKLLRFEQKQIIGYSGRPSDTVLPLVGALRHSLWVAVTSVPLTREGFETADVTNP